MSPRDYWKIGGCAALLGGIAVGFVPLDAGATIDDVVRGRQGQEVALTGQVQVLRPNRFLLRDATGEIRLETCPPWYCPLPLRPGERIRVVGALAPRSRWRLNHPEFVVHRLRREDGSEFRLRFGEGPPPWRNETWRAAIEH